MLAARSGRREVLLLVLVAACVITWAARGHLQARRHDAIGVVAAFSAELSSTSYDALIDSQEESLVARSLRTGRTYGIYRDAVADLCEPATAPSGVCAVLTGLRDEVLIVDLKAGALLRRVRLPTGFGVTDGLGRGGPAWSPDGSLVAVACDLQGEGVEIEGQGFSVIIIESNTGKIRRRIPVRSVSSGQVTVWKLLWGAQGLLVACQDGVTLGIVPESGVERRSYPFRVDAVAPNGEMLVFRDGAHYLTGPDGAGKSRRISIPSDCRLMTFTPDSRYLLFMAGRFGIIDSGEPRLFVADVKTGKIGLLERWATPESSLSLGKLSWVGVEE